MDAAERKPGFVDGDWLWLARRKSGVNPFAVIHDGLRQLLAAHQIWHSARFPSSPWYLPNTQGEGHADPESLVQALARISPLASGARRTSHGLRAFFVTLRRSQGIADGQIAAEIGDSSGASIIASTYGSIPPNWQAKAPLTWLPVDLSPAWANLLPELSVSPGVVQPVVH